jgi:hypothetical protein
MCGIRFVYMQRSDLLRTGFKVEQLGRHNKPGRTAFRYI